MNPKIINNCLPVIIIAFFIILSIWSYRFDVGFTEGYNSNIEEINNLKSTNSYLENQIKIVGKEKNVLSKENIDLNNKNEVLDAKLKDCNISNEELTNELNTVRVGLFQNYVVFTIFGISLCLGFTLFKIKLFKLQLNDRDKFLIFLGIVIIIYWIVYI